MLDTSNNIFDLIFIMKISKKGPLTDNVYKSPVTYVNKMGVHPTTVVDVANVIYFNTYLTLNFFLFEQLSSSLYRACLFSVVSDFHNKLICA